MSTTATIERPRIEKALWELSGFSGDQTQIDGVMVAIDTYAAGMAALLAGAERPVSEAYLHTLITLAEQILDSGGRMRLVPPPSAAKSTATPSTAGRPGTFLNPDGTITCRACGDHKDPAEFSRDKGMGTGRKSRCKTCDKAARK
jgi:hypothetical protein